MVGCAEFALLLLSQQAVGDDGGGKLASFVLRALQSIGGKGKGQAPIRDSIMPAMMRDGNAVDDCGGESLSPAAPAPVSNIAFFDPGGADLHHFHPTRDAFRVLEIGQFTKVRKLADAIFGGVYIYRMRQEGCANKVVAVKRMLNEKLDRVRTFEVNDRMAFHGRLMACEDAMTEIGVLLFLNSQPDMCRYLLRLIDLVRDESHTMLVTEHCDSGDLFGFAMQRELCEAEVKRFMLQLFQALGYLHSHNIGHRDISLENLLVKDGELRLMDFGQAVQLHDLQGPEKRFRYFRPCGKDFYRAPECYIPVDTPWVAPCPSDYCAGSVVLVQHQGFSAEVVFQPESVSGRMCMCDPCGFEAAPVDLFACGVTLFALHARQAPWRMALPADESFRYICTNGIEPLWQQQNKRQLSVSGMHLLSNLLRSHPAMRLSIDQCLDHPWFAGLGAE